MFQGRRIKTTPCFVAVYISFCLLIFSIFDIYDKLSSVKKIRYGILEENIFPKNDSNGLLVSRRQSMWKIMNSHVKPQNKTSPEGTPEDNKTNDELEKIRMDQGPSQEGDASNRTIKLNSPSNDRKATIFPFDYNLTINEPYKCQNVDGSNISVYFLVLITSTQAHFSRRKAIRQTWGSPKKINDRPIVTLFLLAKNTDDKMQSSIEKESKQYNDILMEDFMDTYNNLTLKTFMGIKWATSFCRNVKYIMKTDDDMYVNYGNIINHLSNTTTPTSNYVFGHVLNSSPIRNPRSKYYMSRKEYPGEKYPPFCSGTGYVFSADLAMKVYEAAHYTSYVHLEDVFFGICLLSLQVKPVRREGFYIGRTPYSYCKYKKIFTTHFVTPEKMHEIWDDQQTQKDYKCD